MLAKAHLYYIVQGHSIYTFRLYLTTQESCSHRKTSAAHCEETEQAQERSIFWKRTAVLSFKEKQEWKGTVFQTGSARLCAPSWPLHHLPECHSTTHLLGPQISFKMFLSVAAIQNITQEIPGAMINRIMLHHPWQQIYNLYISISWTQDLSQKKARQGTVQNKVRQSARKVPVLDQPGHGQKLISKYSFISVSLHIIFQQLRTPGKCNLPFLQPDSDLLQDLYCLFVVFQLGLHKGGELAHLFNLQDGETTLQLLGYGLGAVYNMQPGCWECQWLCHLPWPHMALPVLSWFRIWGHPYT